MTIRAGIAVLVVAFAIFVAQACSSSSPVSATGNFPTGTTVTDEEHETALQVLRSATSVETFRVRGSRDSGETRKKDYPRDTTLSIGGFPIEAKGRTQGREFALKLGGFLADPANFRPAGTQPSKCIFDPGVAFRLRSGSDRIEVIVCFTCGELWVDSTKGRLRLPTDEFYPGFSRMSALAKEAFPKDKDLASLR